MQDVADSGGGATLATLSERERSEIEGKFVSAFIRAQKPMRLS
jgi:arsenite methyltransferase